MNDLASAPTSALELTSAAAFRGPLVLEARGLSKDFRLAHGLRRDLLSAARDVSFGLYRSATVALVGESGSGKSTLARLLAGQERPTSGQILLDGRAVKPSVRRQFRAYKRDVQMVFQDPFASLNPVHRVRYHLERPWRIHHSRQSGASVKAGLEQLMTRAQLAPPELYLDKFPHELSGGERQRVAIARALAAGPRVLLADEPVSMLDVSIRLEVMGLLDDLRSRLQLAVLYITHDIASARYFSDEILVMYAGQIVERGPAEDLTLTPAHPYTQLLVASAPDPQSPMGIARGAAPLSTLAGSSLPAVGCRFSHRCPYADQQCRTQTPALLPISSSRAASCWHLDVAAPELLAAGLRGRVPP